MKVYSKDFIYNGISTKSLGVMMCSFDVQSGYNEISGGSTIDISIVKPLHSDKWNFYGANYSEHLSFPIHLVKNDYSEFTLQEQANISSWLVRKDGFHEFQFEDSDYSSILFYATATKISTLNVGDKAVGIRADFICDSPYGYTQKRIETYTGENVYTLLNTSDEFGYIYPKLKIIVKEDGEIKVHNNFDDRTTIIENCINGEVILLDNQAKIITTTSSHDLSNDFNYKWFRLGRTDTENENIMTITGNCEVEMEYQFVRKVGIG